MFPFISVLQTIIRFSQPLPILSGTLTAVYKSFKLPDKIFKFQSYLPFTRLYCPEEAEVTAVLVRKYQINVSIFDNSRSDLRRSIF